MGQTTYTVQLDMLHSFLLTLSPSMFTYIFQDFSVPIPRTLYKCHSIPSLCSCLFIWGNQTTVDKRPAQEPSIYLHKNRLYICILLAVKVFLLLHLRHTLCKMLPMKLSFQNWNTEILLFKICHSILTLKLNVSSRAKLFLYQSHRLYLV